MGQSSSCFEPHYESEAKCKVFIMRTRLVFRSYANKTNFHMKNFAVRLAFIMRFTGSQNGLLL